MKRHEKESSHFLLCSSLFLLLLLAACQELDRASATKAPIPPSSTAQPTFIPDLPANLLRDFLSCASNRQPVRNHPDRNNRKQAGAIVAYELRLAGQIPGSDQIPIQAITVLFDTSREPLMMKVDPNHVPELDQITYSPGDKCDIQTVTADLNRMAPPVVLIDQAGIMKDVAPDKPPSLAQLGFVLKQILRLFNGRTNYQIFLNP